MENPPLSWQTASNISVDFPACYLRGKSLTPVSKTIRQFRSKFNNGTLEQLPSDPWPKKETGLSWGVWTCRWNFRAVVFLGPPGNMEFSFTSLPCRFAEANGDFTWESRCEWKAWSLLPKFWKTWDHACPPLMPTIMDSKSHKKLDGSGACSGCWEHGKEAWRHRGTPSSTRPMNCRMRRLQNQKTWIVRCKRPRAIWVLKALLLRASFWHNWHQLAFSTWTNMRWLMAHAQVLTKVGCCREINIAPGNGGWKTILSFWDTANFQSFCC